MIVESFYLSDERLVGKALDMTGLALDELEGLVGRFTKTSHRSGSLRGELLLFVDGKVVIRHHFSKKQIWKGFYEN